MSNFIDSVKKLENFFVKIKEYIDINLDEDDEYFTIKFQKSVFQKNYNTLMKILDNIDLKNFMSQEEIKEVEKSNEGDIERKVEFIDLTSKKRLNRKEREDFNTFKNAYKKGGIN